MLQGRSDGEKASLAIIYIKNLKRSYWGFYTHTYIHTHIQYIPFCNNNYPFTIIFIIIIYIFSYMHYLGLAQRKLHTLPLFKLPLPLIPRFSVIGWARWCTPQRMPPCSGEGRSGLLQQSQSAFCIARGVQVVLHDSFAALLLYHTLHLYRVKLTMFLPRC